MSVSGFLQGLQATSYILYKYLTGQLEIGPNCYDEGVLSLAVAIQMAQYQLSGRLR